MSRRIFLFVTILMVFSGCATRKACNRRFPTLTSDSIREITKTVTIYQDTTIFIKLPGDTVYSQSIAIAGKVSRLNTQLSISEAWLDNGLLRHRLIQKDTTIARTLKDALRNTAMNYFKNRTTKEYRAAPGSEIAIPKLVMIAVLILVIIILIKKLISLFK